MQEIWRRCLESAGARMGGFAYPAQGHPAVRDYGQPVEELRAAVYGNVICDLGHYSLLSVSGKDTPEFLQNQFTADLRSLQEGESRLAAWCNAKGRMLALFRVFLRRKTFYLRLPAPLAAPIRQRLGMFVLRSQVVIEDTSNTLARMGIAGPAAQNEIQPLLDGASPNDVTALRVPGYPSRFELYGPPEQLSSLWEHLSGEYRPVGEPTWRLREILAGLPEIYPETQETFVPQMTNLQLLGGVDFHKGCYPGQEVVARMHYLGKLKRKLHLARSEPGTVPEPGATVVRSDAGEKAGTVVHAAPHPDGDNVLLAVMREDAIPTNSFRLQDGAALTLIDLPEKAV
jgi:folate-binding protein YgfZ